jgi:putative transposase
VHGNPVRHGFCQHPADWQWSSLHRFLAAGFTAPEVPLALPPWMQPANQPVRAAHP